MDSLNRRQFIAGGGGLVASLTALSAGWPGLLAKAMAAERGLTEARRRTYLAVVAASPEMAPPVSAEAALAALEAWYDAQPDEGRLGLEALLDAIEERDGKSAFSELPPKAGRAQLVAWSSARTKGERDFDAEAHKAGRWSKRGDFEGSIAANEKRIAEIVDAVKAQYGEEALGLDRETGLPRWTPPPYEHAHKPRKPDKGSHESRLRAIGAAAASLALLPHDADRVPAVR